MLLDLNRHLARLEAAALWRALCLNIRAELTGLRTGRILAVLP